MISEAEKLIEKTENALQVAKELLSNRHYPEAVSKAYYVMFYCALALLINNDIKRTSHSGVISAFGHFFAKTKKIDPQYHRMFTKAYIDRETADYDIYKTISEGLAKRRVEEAEEFLNEIKKHLQ
ncbi:MAG: HEPN domain-containing protein [Candidatus Aerophobetes bacterium]|nr:HEPN domain-containing protein [Candidatus Aerophobetes bacterium]